MSEALCVRASKLQSGLEIAARGSSRWPDRPAPVFQAGGRVGRRRTDTFDLPTLPRRARGSQRRPRLAGRPASGAGHGARLARQYSGAPGHPPARRELHEHLQAAMHHRVLGSRPLHLISWAISTRRFMPAMSSPLPPPMPKPRADMCPDPGGRRFCARASSAASRAARLRGQRGPTAFPDTPTLNPRERQPVTRAHLYRRVAAAAIAGAICGPVLRSVWPLHREVVRLTFRLASTFGPASALPSRA